MLNCLIYNLRHKDFMIERFFRQVSIWSIVPGQAQSAQLLSTNIVNILTISIFSDGGCVFQENAEKQISVEEDTPPGNDGYCRRLHECRAN